MLDQGLRSREDLVLQALAHLFAVRRQSLLVDIVVLTAAVSVVVRLTVRRGTQQMWVIKSKWSDMSTTYLQ